MDEEYRKYLAPDVIARLANMEIVARLVVEGFIAGLHKSPYHGFSVEFAEHRQYMPGDEIRHVDWKIYAKTGRYFIKEFEEETNLKATIILDASSSMGFASGSSVTKLAYGSYLAAALSYLMIQQRDAVGLAVFDEKVRTYLPPRSTRSYLQQLLKHLTALAPGSTTDTAPSLHRIAERIRRRGLVIVISDLFDDQAKVMSALKHLRHTKNEVIVMQVLDPLERSFAFGSDAVFKDMETGEQMTTHPWHIQRSYRAAMEQFLERYRTQCREHNIDYVLMDTSTPFDIALTKYLGTRQRIS